MSLEVVDLFTYLLFALKLLAITLALLMFVLGLDDLYVRDSEPRCFPCGAGPGPGPCCLRSKNTTPTLLSKPEPHV